MSDVSSGREKDPVDQHPLSRRLRNPPPTFLGREADIALVHEAMRRGPLVVVWGPGGMGKTALWWSTIDLAHSLGITVVAEGVETDDVLQRLRALGCDLAQGFCLAHPAPADDTTEWLLGRRSEAA
jgi:hypothetical protein